MRITIQALTLLALLGASVIARGQTLQVPMQLLDADGGAKSIGTVTVTSAGEGVTFTPKLTGLLPGIHGFHVHEKLSCDAATDPQSGKLTPGQAAGGHLDPEKTNRHEVLRAKVTSAICPHLRWTPTGTRPHRSMHRA